MSTLARLPAAEVMEYAQQQRNGPTKHQIQLGHQRKDFVDAVQAHQSLTGCALTPACQAVATALQDEAHELHALAQTIGHTGRLISASQLNRWVKAYQKNGLDGLVDKRKPRQRAQQPWHLRAQCLYASPQRPSGAEVHRRLEKEGFQCEYNQVWRWLKSLSTNLTDLSAGRLGAKEVRLNHRRYVSRSTENLKPGDIWSMDGHTVDVYTQHPTGQRVHRLELTLVLDIASRYVVGFWLSNAESANSTLFALSDAIQRWNHVPSMLHIDNGSGYKNQMMNDEHHGFYHRFGIEVMFAIPGNAKGKGHVERFFGTLKEQFHKSFDSYCGDDMSASVLNKLVRDANSGKLTLPSQKQYQARLVGWLAEYHQRGHRGLEGATPASHWAQLERTELHLHPSSLVLPQQPVHIRRNRFVLHKRYYEHRDLELYNGKSLVAQYSLTRDDVVQVLDDQGRHLFDASLIKKQAYVPDSRIEEARIKSLAAAKKRLQKKIAEQEQRHALITGEGSAQSFLTLAGDGLPEPAETVPNLIAAAAAEPVPADVAEDEPDFMALALADLALEAEPATEDEFSLYD
jgi:putative transposase